MKVEKMSVNGSKKDEFFDNYIEGKDFCKRIGITVKTLWRWRDDGMPYQPFGREMWVNPLEVAEWHRRRK
jgi:hypothetical protein